MTSILKITLTSFLLIFQSCMHSQHSLDSVKQEPDMEETLASMFSLLRGDNDINKTIKKLDNSWHPGFVPILLDIIYFSRKEINEEPIIKLIEDKTDQSFGNDLFEWHNWLWNKDPQLLSYQGDWMALIYKNIDPKFYDYFRNRTADSDIRLDEIKWGGVLQDGIPPLRSPEMISAEEADYLEDDNIVFGISINDDHRAYPKRILAWHEMFVDDIGGESIAGVYCTLCGTVIAYNTKYNGENYELGTSGFLYRSNKLMYDKTTQSLWNTIEGKPVLGPLIKSNIELNSHSVVTTTWGEWKKIHPKTSVLSLNTGHRRDYDEGVAYKDYFSNDELMFKVPNLDTRLSNKDEVLIVRAKGYKEDPLAISTKYLSKNRVYQDKIGNIAFVVLSDKSGANRVYQIEDQVFVKLKDDKAIDKEGRKWSITEEHLESADGLKLMRLPYHRIFWFAWYNTYKNTRLVL